MKERRLGEAGRKTEDPAERHPGPPRGQSLVCAGRSAAGDSECGRLDFRPEPGDLVYPDCTVPVGL
jgi:hypothetical protein